MGRAQPEPPLPGDAKRTSEKWTRMWWRARAKKTKKKEKAGRERGGGGGGGRSERLQGQMVQRSYHCLPSDSDKFTIKLHSFPSKCPSSVRVRFILLRSNPGPRHPVSIAFSASLAAPGRVEAPSRPTITITLFAPAPKPSASFFHLFVLDGLTSPRSSRSFFQSFFPFLDFSL